MSERVLVGPKPAAPLLASRGVLQRATINCAPINETPSLVNDVLNSPGQPLDTATRAFMEPRFGHDFSHVRVHTDARAAQSAHGMGARSYTVGQNVAFGAGEYAPATGAGQRLIAHELTHVVQQMKGHCAGHIQRKPNSKPPSGGTQTTRFKIIVDRELDAAELVHEFVRQYYSFTTEAQIQSKLSLWTNNSNTGATAADVAKGYVMANVTTASQTNFETLDSKEKEAVNTETDKRFWESTGYKPGEKLGTSAQDKQMARVWTGVRNAVLTEDKQRKEIEALPDDIKSVLFAGDANAPTIAPDDYDQVLRMAHKLAQLAPEARQDYLARINASTTSRNEMEGSIDSYIQFQAQREKQSEENETAAKPLLGMDDVYRDYRYYKDHLYDIDPSPRDTSAYQKFLDEQKRERKVALLAALKQKGFDSIETFEQSVEAYRITFRTQAVNLALDVLARYDHMLFEERKKIQQPGAVAAIVQGISATQASSLYKEAATQKSTARNLRMAHEPKETWWIKPTQEAEKASAQAHASAESEVIRGSGNDPLVSERGTNREKLAGLDVAGAQAYLSETLEARAADARAARQEFKDDPDRVFKLPELVSASQKIQGIDADSVYGKIISDYIQDEHDKHLLSSIAIGILALALAFLVPGGGWVAAAALVANAGISTYQAYTAIKEYEEQERDYNLHFLSEEPSLFWVGVAIAAAALDLGMAGGALVKESSAALKTLQTPLMEFSKDGDLAKLFSKIEAADLQKGLKTALEGEAKKALESSREAWKDAIGLASRANGLMPGVVDPGILKQAFRALYYQVKRGVTTIAKLRADAKYLDAVGDITRMSGAERAELETAFDEVKQLVKAGQAKSMDDASLLGYVDRWALNRSKPGFQTKLFEEMKAWKPLTEEQQRALNALNAQKSAVTTLYEQKSAAEAELAELRIKPDKTAEDVAEIRNLENELSRLDPITHPPKKPAGKGQIAEAEQKLAQVEKEADKAQLTLYDRLRAAAPADAARERALKGVTVDQVGALKTKPTPLQADHVVSVREISDMDGFADLPWKDQKAIVDMKENLIAMDGAANASKGDRTWRSWGQASNFYGQTTIENMMKRESEVRAIIQEEIKNRLSKILGAKP